MKPDLSSRRPWRRLLVPVPVLLALLAGGLTGAGAVQLYASRLFEVEKPSENIRANPEGRQIGTLLEGAQVEEVDRDGKWVKFRIEAWIWGPSLEGYRDGPSKGGAGPQSREEEEDDVEATRKPRTALALHLDDVRDLIEESFGRFYGMRLDPDMGQVQIRFRVRDLEREALERRQMRVQHAVWELLREGVEFESLRVETNRPDGSGEVGVEQAVAEVADIRRIKGEDFRLWRQTTRRSSDGGETWTD